MRPSNHDFYRQPQQRFTENQIRQASFETLKRHPELLVENDKDGYNSDWKKILVFGGIFFFLSIGLTIFNALFLSKKYYHFPFPIFTAALTGFFHFGLAVAFAAAYGILGDSFKSLLDWNILMKALLPCALAASIDVAFSHVSLQLVSVSFFTMVKSSAIIFLMIGTFVIGAERVRFSLLVIMFIISCGVGLAAYNPSIGHFDALGFSLVLGASMMSGVKFTLTQLLLSSGNVRNAIKNIAGGSKGGGDSLIPLVTVLYLSPLISTCLLVISAIFEGFPMFLLTSPHFQIVPLLATLLSLTFIVAVLSFTYILAEYRLIQLISLLSFSILGVVRELTMIAISVAALHETLHPLNYIGLAVSVSGILLYHYGRWSQQVSAKEQTELITSTRPVSINEFELEIMKTSKPRYQTRYQMSQSVHSSPKL